MMKRVLACLICGVVLLSGCVKENPEETTTQPQTTAPTQPAPGLYFPGATVERDTDGAVRGYVVSGLVGNDILHIGKDLLLLSYGNGKTVITRVSGENCSVVRSGIVGDVRADDLYILDNRIAYYDLEDRCAVYLDSRLQETERIALPEDILAEPVFSNDLSVIYYCTAKEVRAFDIRTGISRLLCQQEKDVQYPVQVILGGSALQCHVVDGGNVSKQFLSTETGQVLHEVQNLESLAELHNDYFAICVEGSAPEYVFGSREGQQQALHLAEEIDGITPLLDIHSAVTVTAQEDAVGLTLYDLETGRKTAAVNLPGCAGGYSFVADSTGTYIWFLTWDAASQSNLLCRWDYGMTPVEDTQIYTGVRYTRENPDTQGLAACQQRADALSTQYGVKLLIDDTLPLPENYSFVYEYKVPAFEAAMDILEAAFARFPEGFLGALEDGNLRIGLVRSIHGTLGNTVPDGNGLQYWLGSEGYIALAMGDDLEDNFYHQLAHVLDAHVYSDSLAYDEWYTMNPAGFAYDGSYDLYQTRTDNQYLEGAGRAFVDEFSKTFAKEDRARIFQYAMQEGTEEVFASEIMQRKLRQICVALRTAYDWKKDERTFLWEQYLTESIAYTKK